jgi:hypothetical protein
MPTEIHITNPDQIQQLPFQRLQQLIRQEQSVPTTLHVENEEEIRLLAIAGFGGTY